MSVRRRDVDGYGIQGFLVGQSEQLLALEYVYDFQVDGLMILRQSDITEVLCTETDRFQESLLKKEGIRPSEQSSAPLELSDWRSIIEQLAKQHEYMILEPELGPVPEFAIGRVVRTTAAQVELQAFSGTGRWSSKTQRLKYSQLTSAQVNTRYLGFYQRHFQRGAA